jgi:MoaA/NifB/PqqE/SkfB family radical SAM enzyme
MSRALFEKIALEVGKHQKYIKVGNIEEPLLHPDLVHFVRFSMAHGAAGFHITTNGTLMTRQLAGDLMDAGLTSIYFSMDAFSDEGYKAIRHGNLKDLTARVDAFLDEKAKRKANIRTGISMILQEPVLNEVDAFTDYWIKKTDVVIVYQLSRVQGIEDVHRGYFFDPPKQRTPCPLPWTEMYVLPEGEVITCCRADLMVGRVGIFCMGNVSKNSLQEVWGGRIYSEYRDQLFGNDKNHLPQICYGCSIFTANDIRSYKKNGYCVQENSFVRSITPACK